MPVARSWGFPILANCSVLFNNTSNLFSTGECIKIPQRTEIIAFTTPVAHNAERLLAGKSQRDCGVGAFEPFIR